MHVKKKMMRCEYGLQEWVATLSMIKTARNPTLAEQEEKMHLTKQACARASNLRTMNRSVISNLYWSNP